MTYDQLQNKIDQARTTAASIAEAFNASVEKIRNNTTLSSEGKMRTMARLYIDTQAKVAAQSDAEKNAIAAERTAVDRALFGTPASSDPTAMIAFRDAQDRAERIEDETTAMNTLNRTDTTGDTELASAVLNQAVSMGWFNVVEAFAATHPGKAALVDELVALANLTKPQNYLMSAWSYIVPKPLELGAVADYRIEQLATQPAA
jgi:hypothetical protein